jgi:hypothetical protein
LKIVILFLKRQTTAGKAGILKLKQCKEDNQYKPVCFFTSYPWRKYPPPPHGLFRLLQAKSTVQHKKYSRVPGRPRGYEAESCLSTEGGRQEC